MKRNIKYRKKQAYLIERKEYKSFDELLRPSKVEYSDGTFEIWSYSCCGVETYNGRRGIETRYIYDVLGRVEAKIEAGVIMV